MRQHKYGADLLGMYYIGVHIEAMWRIQLNRPCAAAMQPCVKLLWPLVIIVINSKFLLQKKWRNKTWKTAKKTEEAK